MAQALSARIGADLVTAILQAPQITESDFRVQRQRVAALKTALKGATDPDAVNLLSLADFLVRRSVWIVGGDGWAYDIDYGGLDHVLASGKNVNILVLDTEVYSNTGGQASKATPLGASAKFAAAGKTTPRKDLAMMAIAYGNVYVAQIAMGANNEQALVAMREAEAYAGTSLILSSFFAFRSLSRSASADWVDQLEKRIEVCEADRADLREEVGRLRDRELDLMRRLLLLEKA